MGRGVPVSPIGQGPVTQPDTNPVDQRTGQSATWLVQLLNDLRTGVIKVANQGTTAERPVDPLLGELYYDTSVISSGSIGIYFFCDTIRDANTSTPAHWTALGPGGGGTVDITATPPIQVTPNPITGTGDIEHMASGVTPGTYGATTKIPQFTVEVDGHITHADEREQCPCSEISPALIFQFPSNNVLQFLTDNAGVVEQRVVISATLGDGVTVEYGGGFSGDGSGCGIYNPVDDKIYFLSRKYDTVTMGVIDTTVWKNMLVQWNPRTQLITNEMELPTGWCVPNGRNGPGSTACSDPACTLVDVSDRVAWIFYEFGDATIKGISTVSFTEVFTSTPGDGGLCDNYTTGLFMVGGQSGQLALANTGSGNFELIQTTGPLTTDYVSLRVLLPAASLPLLTESGDVRRFWLPTKNLFGFYYTGGFAGPLFAVIVNPVSGATFFVYQASTNINQTFWDTLTGFFYGVSGTGGELEISETGSISGLYASDGNWGVGIPIGGTVFMWSVVFLGGAEFKEFDLANALVPAATYETTSFSAAPETWQMTSQIQDSVFVLRRVLPVPVVLPSGQPSGSEITILSSFYVDLTPVRNTDL